MKGGGDGTPPVRGPVQGLADLSELIADHPVNTGAFVRGLTIGALVGAAVAGLSVWRRLHSPRSGDRR